MRAPYMAPIPARLPRTRTPRADLPGARGANNAPPPQTFIALLDNYERETGIAERTTAVGKVPYYIASHTNPHTTLHSNKNREDLRQRKFHPPPLLAMRGGSFAHHPVQLVMF
jgi:hypothetical protein